MARREPMLRARDVRQEKIEKIALALREIDAAAMQAQQEECSGGLFIGKNGGDFAVDSEWTIQRSVKFRLPKGFARDDI
jgi:hypothetical protein